jgi:nucleotide-binding universal stress UspA family protein
VKTVTDVTKEVIETVSTVQRPLRRVLVATDGSDSARAAVELGVSLAAMQHADVVFLHIAPPVAWRYSRLASARPIPRRLEASTDQALREALGRAAEAGVSAKAELIAGEPAREIASVAEIVDADLLVVGQTNRNPLREHVTPAVARRAKCPVLIARRQPLRWTSQPAYRRAA